jgi:threonine dehydratase
MQVRLDLPTPLVAAPSLSGAGSETYLKNETVLPTGSFKVRGALHSLTVNLARRSIGEVVAASTGNHGAAVAWAAKAAGCRATIFLPSNPNPVKAARIRGLDARIVEAGADLSAAIEAASAYAESGDAFFLHDAADPDVPAGTATIGAEIVAQQPAVDRLYVPMGDTALVRGVAAAVKRVKPATRIVGVVAANAPAYLLSWQQGKVVETDTAATIADGLAVRRPLPDNVTVIRRLVDEVQAVTEEEMLAAIHHLRRHERITAEPAGAAATAAYLRNPPPTGCSVVLVTGGNIPPEVMERVTHLRAS